MAKTSGGTAQNVKPAISKPKVNSGRTAIANPPSPVRCGGNPFRTNEGRTSSKYQIAPATSQAKNQASVARDDMRVSGRNGLIIAGRRPVFGKPVAKSFH
ncbi:MAG: hypothetical protein ACJA0Y_001938 [Maricaulis maris]|jgi:hypothetical protein